LFYRKRKMKASKHRSITLTIFTGQQRHDIPNGKRIGLVIGALIFALTAIVAFSITENKNYREATFATISRKVTRHLTHNISTPDITPTQDVCRSEYPPYLPTLYDHRPDHVSHYTTNKYTRSQNYNIVADDFPPVTDMPPNSKYSLLSTGDTVNSKASAWDPNTNVAVKGPWFHYPDNLMIQTENVIELEGDFVSYNTWIRGNYAHFLFDWLPTISYLRIAYPETTKIILAYDKLSEKILKFLDEDFSNNRVQWVEVNQVYQIKGKLTVTTPKKIPETIGCHKDECRGWDPMRQWIAEKHPEKIEKKHVLFYRRGGATTTGKRVLDPTLEKIVLEHIRQKLIRHGRNEEIKIFTGEDENGNTLSMEDQFTIFRGASTIIGPHGSGISGNFAWTDPFPSNCEERTQLLEFVPSRENSGIHALYADSFGEIRKWPLDFHALLYSNEYSDEYEYTQINLQDFDNALDAMWGGIKQIKSSNKTASG